MELDYQDEEQLLSTPPQSHKEHNTSPRRSPRLFRKEVTRSKKETSSPGKKALSRKEGSQEPQPKEDHTQASSQGKTTPRKEVSEHSRAVISSQARKKTSRKEDGGYSRTMTFSLARKQNSRREDGGQSRTVTSSPARKQNSRKEDGVQSRAENSKREQKCGRTLTGTAAKISMVFREIARDLHSRGRKTGSEEGTVSHHLLAHKRLDARSK